MQNQLNTTTFNSLFAIFYRIIYLDEILKALSIIPFLVPDPRSKVDDANKKIIHISSPVSYTHMDITTCI